jgi:hypothetical protein
MRREEGAGVDDLPASLGALRSATWRLNPGALTSSNGPVPIATFTCVRSHSGAQWCAACGPFAPYDRVDSGHQQPHALQSWTGIGARNMRWPG